MFWLLGGLLLVFGLLLAKYGGSWFFNPHIKNRTLCSLGLLMSVSGLGMTVLGIASICCATGQAWTPIIGILVWMVIIGVFNARWSRWGGTNHIGGFS